MMIEKNSRFIKKLFCTTALACLISNSAAAYVTPETFNRLDYVVSSSLQSPEMASNFAQNLLGTSPDYRLVIAAKNGDAQTIRNLILEQLQSKDIVSKNEQKLNDNTLENAKGYVEGADNTSYNKNKVGISTTNAILIGGGITAAITAGVLAGGSHGKGDGAAASGEAWTEPSTPAITCADSGNDVTDCPEDLDTESFKTSEYKKHYSSDDQDMLGGLKAEYAYARGITGQGVTIGVFDWFSKNVTKKSDLAGKIVYKNLTGSNDEGGEVDADTYHGDYVAMFAAGTKNNAGAHGVAYNATLALESVLVENQTFTTAFENLIDAGAKVINISIAQINEDGTQTQTPSTDFLTALTASEAANVVVTAGAGNQCTSDSTNCVNPTYPGRSANSTEANGSMLVVGAVEKSGSVYSITDFSNKAGDAKNYYVVVPTTWGTSSASPGAAGAVALIRQAWPHLTAAQTVDLILTTADDIGNVGVDTTYGHGLIDIEAAFNPVGGSTSINSNGYKGASLNSSYINASKAFGDSFSNSKNKISFTDKYNRVFKTDAANFANDSRIQKSTSYVGALARLGNENKTSQIKGDGYSINLAEYTSSNFDNNKSASENKKATATASFNSDENTSFKIGYGGDAGAALIDDFYTTKKNNLIKPEANYNPYLGMYDYDTSFAGISTKFADDSSVNINFVYGKELEDTNLSSQSQATSMASILNYNKKLSDSINIGFTNGFLLENGSLLGSKTSGAFDVKDGASTVFFGADFKFDLTDDVALTGAAFKGFTNATPSKSSVYSDFSNIETESFNAGIESKNNFAKDDNFMLSVFQGLRVSGGTAKGAFFGQDASGSYTRNSFSESMQPEGRELTLQAVYSSPLTEKVDVSVAAQATQDPNNNVNKQTEQAVLGKVTVDLD